jgi:hypothetical protein
MFADRVEELHPAETRLSYRGRTARSWGGQRVIDGYLVRRGGLEWQCTAELMCLYTGTTAVSTTVRKYLGSQDRW